MKLDPITSAAPRATISVPSVSTVREYQDYARELRPLLPPEAFRTNPDRLALVLINLVILVLGWGLAHRLERWPLQWLPLFLPFALVMANSIVVLLFASHDLLHGNALRQLRWRRVVGLVGLAVLWMPPTLWQAVHNREHHGNTNALADPDRSYLERQGAGWGSWIQHQFVPSSEVRPLGLLLGMGGSWAVHNLRTLIAVLQGEGHGPTPAPARFAVGPVETRRILIELAVIALGHALVIAGIGLAPLPLLLGYVLPLWLGYAGAMAYIYTNHFLSPLTEVNDPLLNTLSLKVPRWLDALHLNFSHHVEHHIFPGLNTDYYPMVRRLLIDRYGDRYKQLPAARAWQLLMATPRYYRNSTTLVNQAGDHQLQVPLAG